MKLFRDAPINIVLPTASTPLTSMRAFVARGNVYRVRTLQLDPPCCFTCFGLFPTEEQVGVLDGAETKRRVKADFPYMQDTLHTQNLAVLNATAEAGTQKHIVTSQANEGMQFSILRGASTHRTYVVLAKTKSQDGENWNSVQGGRLYYYQGGYDKNGQSFSVDAVEKTVRIAVQRWRGEWSYTDGPLDGAYGFKRCDDYSSTRYS